MNKVLTIAGSDCSGGAGIQADLKTIGAFRLYGMSVLTAVTVQNTLGVYRVAPVEASVVEEQLRAVFEDIPPDAVKIGMVVNKANIRAIVSVIREYKPVVVLDPVMVSTSGKKLLDDEATEALCQELFPLVRLITPNLPEAEALWGRSIGSDPEREQAARQLAASYGCSVLIKGGHSGQSAGAGRSSEPSAQPLARAADDLLYDRQKESRIWFRNEKILSQNTHGTGCTLSSAIACGLAEGRTLEESVREAKEYVTGAIRAGLDLGHGNGPLNHIYIQEGRKANGIKY